MKIWKRNAIVAVVFVFVCAGVYLNWFYSKQEEVPVLEDTLDSQQVMDAMVLPSETEEAVLSEVPGECAESFASIRLSRQGARDAAIEALQETISYAGGDGSATTTSKELENLVQASLQEAQIESLIVAKGYQDCVAYMTDEGISVAVAAPAEGLKETDVALISDIVTSQTEFGLSDVRIIEVK